MDRRAAGAATPGQDETRSLGAEVARAQLPCPAASQAPELLGTERLNENIKYQGSLQEYQLETEINK